MVDDVAFSVSAGPPPGPLAGLVPGPRSENLVTNGDFEQSPAQGVVPVGWTETSGTFHSNTYATTTILVPPGGGLGLATLLDFGVNSATQVLDVTPFATAIDAGREGFDLSALLGGGFDARVTATFNSAGGGTLGCVSIGPSTSPATTGLTPFVVSAGGSGGSPLLVPTSAKHCTGRY